MKFSDLKSHNQLKICVAFIGPDLREKPCLTELLQQTIITLVNQDDEKVEQEDEEEEYPGGEELKMVLW